MWLHIRKVYSDSEYNYLLMYPEKPQFNIGNYDYLFSELAIRKLIISKVKTEKTAGDTPDIALELNFTERGEWIDDNIIWNVMIPKYMYNPYLEDTKIRVKYVNFPRIAGFEIKGYLFDEDRKLMFPDTIYQNVKHISPDFYNAIMPDDIKNKKDNEEKPFCKLHFDVVDKDDDGALYYIAWIEHNIPDTDKYKEDLKVINTVQYFLATRKFAYLSIFNADAKLYGFKFIEWHTPPCKSSDFWNLAVPNDKVLYRLPEKFTYEFECVKIQYNEGIVISLRTDNPFNFDNSLKCGDIRHDLEYSVALVKIGRNIDFLRLLIHHYPKIIEPYIKVLEYDICKNSILNNMYDQCSRDYRFKPVHHYLFKNDEHIKPSLKSQEMKLRKSMDYDCSSFVSATSIPGYWAKSGYSRLLGNPRSLPKVFFDIEGGSSTVFTNMEINNCFSIKNIKFSGYKVIVFWKDNTKTIVTMQDDEDNYDVEKAIMAAFTKKILSYRSSAKERSVNNLLDEWTAKYEKEREDIEAHRKELDKRKSKK